MAWDVSKPVMEVRHDFVRAIPGDSRTWVRIDKVRPSANMVMEATLSEATLIYRDGEVQQRQTVHWELVKMTACWLTLIETNFEAEGKAIFPRRSLRHREVDRREFVEAWARLLPPEITDEWMAAVLEANPLWYEMLRLWVPLWWLREWMPDKLETVERDGREVEQPAVREEDSLGEGSSE